MNVAKINDAFEISFDIKNTGDVKGEEVAQLYIAPKNIGIERSVKELKGFEKVLLNPE
jgi:beta-glucosidase